MTSRFIALGIVLGLAASAASAFEIDDADNRRIMANAVFYKADIEPDKNTIDNMCVEFALKHAKRIFNYG